jgi:hypothetical protein
LHPRYLDAQGLVALWREALLARAVLRGETRGYRHHPQLERFRAHAYPVSAINAYLRAVLAEADRRAYRFSRAKVGRCHGEPVIPVTRGQLAYEWEHLLRKLAQRSPALCRQWRMEKAPKPHPLFSACAGAVEPWERNS